MIGTRLVIVESLGAGSPTPAADDLVVAATPEAMHELSRRGVEYIPLYEFVSGDLLANENKHWKEQIAWLELFDELIRRNAKVDLGSVEPATLFGYQLKVATDAVRIRLHELTCVLERSSEVAEVALWCGDTERDRPPTLWFDRGPSLFARLLPLLAARAGLPYTEVIVGSPMIAISLPAPATTGHAAAARIRGLLRRLNVLRRVGRRRLTLVLVHPLYDLATLWRNASRAGHRVLLFDEGRLIDGRSGAVIDELAPTESWSALADLLTAEDSALWEWPRSWVGGMAVEVLRDPLAHFVANVAPALVTGSDSLASSLQGMNASAVVVPMLTDVPTCTAVAAARRAAIPSIQVDHGDGATESQVWDLMHLFHLDHEIAPCAELASYFRARSRWYDRATAEVHIGSYRWRTVRRLRAARVQRTGRPILIYAVTAMAGDTRYLNNAWYSDTWYFDLQRALVDALAAVDEFEIVVKLFPANEDKRPQGPIADYVRALDLETCRVSEERFVDWLPRADRVLLDTASTALYETALAGVPVRLLVHTSVPIRAGALEIFRPTVARFGSFTEAAALARDFAREADPPRVLLEPEGRDLLRTVREIAVVRRVRPPHLSRAVGPGPLHDTLGVHPTA